MRLYDHVRVVAPGLRLDRRPALEAAARSLDLSTEVDAALERARRRLADLEVDAVPSLAEAKRAVAETHGTVEERRERVATLRGRLQAADADGNGAGEVAEAYRSAIRSLSEAETDHAAAREALEAARERAREVRDRRERRLRLEDRVGNLRRRARAARVERIRPAVDEVVPTVPGAAASTYVEADSVTAALALLRVGRVRVPVVLACRRFDGEADAESWLGTPVLEP